jgi:hypothetical protein
VIPHRVGGGDWGRGPIGRWRCGEGRDKGGGVGVCCMVGGGCRRDGLSVEHCGMSRGWGERDEAGAKRENE